MSKSVQKFKEQTLKPSTGDRWHVVLRNCYCHSFEEAVEQIARAIVCSLETAHSYARTAELCGEVAVYEGDLQACEAVARTLGATGLDVTVAC